MEYHYYFQEGLSDAKGSIFTNVLPVLIVTNKDVEEIIGKVNVVIQTKHKLAERGKGLNCVTK